MERFVFLKIMNNQTQRFPSLVVSAAILCVSFAAAPAPGQTQTPSGADRVSVNLSDPARPALVKASLVNGGITIKGYDGELDVNDVNGSVTLNNVSGSAVAHALNGRLLATFSRVNPQKPMAFSSLNGDIDVTFPPDLKANLSLKSDRGEIFSDFDVQVQVGLKIGGK